MEGGGAKVVFKCSLGAPKLPSDIRGAPFRGAQTQWRATQARRARNNNDACFPARCSTSMRARAKTHKVAPPPFLRLLLARPVRLGQRNRMSVCLSECVCARQQTIKCSMLLAASIDRHQIGWPTTTFVSNRRHRPFAGRYKVSRKESERVCEQLVSSDKLKGQTQGLKTRRDTM